MLGPPLCSRRNGSWRVCREHKAEIVRVDSDWPEIDLEEKAKSSAHRSARKSHVRDLHFRLNRQTEGRDGDTRQRCAAAEGDRTLVPLQRSGRLDVVPLLCF